MLLGLILEVALVLLLLQAAVVYLRAFFRDGVLGHKSIVGLIMGVMAVLFLRTISLF